MSGYNNWSDPDDLEQVAREGGGGLRKLLEETLAENKKLREAVEGKERQKSASDLLKANGLDPAIAELIPKEEDPAKWVEKYAHLLGKPQNTELLEESEPVAPEVQVPDDSDPAVVAEREALQAMRDAQESGTPAVVTSDLLEQMSKIDNEEELLKFFGQHGAPDRD